MNIGKASATIKVLPPMKIISVSSAWANAFSIAVVTDEQTSPCNPCWDAKEAKSSAGMARWMAACVKK